MKPYAYKDYPFYVLAYPHNKDHVIMIFVCPNTGQEYIRITIGQSNFKALEQIVEFTNTFERAKSDFNMIYEDIQNIFELYERYKDNKL